jgi:hypothetical protein
MCLSIRHSPDNKDRAEKMSDESDPIPQDNEQENEVLRAARERRQQQEAADAAEAEAKGGKRGLAWKAAAGLGIGSAAVIAALLYANRDKIK